MELFLGLTAWLGLAIGAGAIASAKGRSGFAYFLLGLLLPIVGILVAIGMPQVKERTAGGWIVCHACPKTRPTHSERCPHCGAGKPDLHAGQKKCPACAEWVLAEAKKCKHCGEELAGVTAHGPGVTPSPKAAPSQAERAARYIPPAQSSGDARRTFTNLAKVGGPLAAVLVVGYCVIGNGSSPPKQESEAARWGNPAPTNNTIELARSPGKPLTPQEVREVQTRLKALGFDPGGADGVAGPNTTAAVKRFEESKRWRVTGDLDDGLLSVLRASDPTVLAAPRNPAPPSGNPIGDAQAGDPKEVALRALRHAEHPCPSVNSASKMSDGSIRATCSNGETYRIGTLKGEPFALRCSAAARLGVTGC